MLQKCLRFHHSPLSQGDQDGGNDQDGEKADSISRDTKLYEVHIYITDKHVCACVRTHTHTNTEIILQWFHCHHQCHYHHKSKLFTHTRNQTHSALYILSHLIGLSHSKATFPRFQNLVSGKEQKHDQNRNYEVERTLCDVSGGLWVFQSLNGLGNSSRPALAGRSEGSSVLLVCFFVTHPQV